MQPRHLCYDQKGLAGIEGRTYELGDGTRFVGSSTLCFTNEDTILYEGKDPQLATVGDITNWLPKESRFAQYTDLDGEELNIGVSFLLGTCTYFRSRYAMNPSLLISDGQLLFDSLLNGRVEKVRGP